MTDHSDYVELIRIGDPVEADLLAAFLGDGDVAFQVVNRSGAGFMSGLMPRAMNPVMFRILESDLERGQQLLEEYRTLQKASLPPDDPEEGDVGSENETLTAEEIAPEAPEES